MPELTTGTITLIPFPFAELTNVKVRPALVVCTTHDKHHDLVLCAISSVVPKQAGAFELLLQPRTLNKLRVASLLKVDRIVTLKQTDVIATLDRLSNVELADFKNAFRQMVA